MQHWMKLIPGISNPWYIPMKWTSHNLVNLVDKNLSSSKLV